MFFLSIEEDYSPIGFVHSPSAVKILQWSSGKGKELRLLVCCIDGSMMEVEAPVKGQYDTAKTYYLDPLKFTTRKFASIKDKLLVRAMLMSIAIYVPQTPEECNGSYNIIRLELSVKRYCTLITGTHILSVKFKCML